MCRIRGDNDHSPHIPRSMAKKHKKAAAKLEARQLMIGALHKAFEYDTTTSEPARSQIEAFIRRLQREVESLERIVEAEQEINR
jgi:hypothetical protein